MRYAVVIEKGDRNYSAYVPDLPGCVSTGRTLEEVKAEIREAIEFHIEGMLEDGLAVLPPASCAEYIEIHRESDVQVGLSTTTGRTKMTKDQLYVERRGQGDYAVRRANSDRASAIEPTQAKAIERAREMNPGHSPVVERVRNTVGGHPDKWRKA